MILLLFCGEMHMADKLPAAASENNMHICASVRLSKYLPPELEGWIICMCVVMLLHHCWLQPAGDRKILVNCSLWEQLTSAAACKTF